jgi:hypothetical protein
MHTHSSTDAFESAEQRAARGSERESQSSVGGRIDLAAAHIIHKTHIKRENRLLADRLSDEI